MNVSSFNGKKFKNVKPAKKKQIPISISIGVNPLFQQAKVTNIATSYKESSERMKIQNIGKCLNLRDISKKLYDIATYYSTRHGIPNRNYLNTINTSSAMPSQRNPVKHSIKSNDSNFKHPRNESKPANAKHTLSKDQKIIKEKQTTLTIDTSMNSLKSSKTKKPCGKPGQVIGKKTVNLNLNAKNKQISNCNQEEIKIVDKYSFKKIPPIGIGSLSILNMKQKYKELVKENNLPLSIALRKSLKLSIDSQDNVDVNKNQHQRGSSVYSKFSNGHDRDNNSLTLNKDVVPSKSKQLINWKKIIFPVPKNSNPYSTKNISSVPIEINLQSLIKDNCMTLKRANKLHYNLPKEKFSIEELTNEVENVNNNNNNTYYNYELTSNSINHNSLEEFDNFDDINSIIRKLQFDQIDIKKENIFSQGNFLYKNFEERFNTDFELAINRNRNSGRKNVDNISLSTQDNSSKKGISPLNSKSGHELRYYITSVN